MRAVPFVAARDLATGPLTAVRQLNSSWRPARDNYSLKRRDFLLTCSSRARSSTSFQTTPEKLPGGGRISRVSRREDSLAL